MKKWKGFFLTHKKGFIAAGCALAALIVLGTFTALAANTVARGSSIGEENAQNFAFADAGVDPVKAQGVHTEFDYEQGQFIYDVEFYVDGTEYEYWIKASDGSVVKRNAELMDGDDVRLAGAGTAGNGGESGANPGTGTEAGAGASTGQTAGSANSGGNGAASDAGVTPTAAGQEQIDLEKAKEIALADAGVSADDAVFTKAKQDYDDRILVYEIEFYTSSNEYDYEIDASNGSVRSREAEPLQAGRNPAAAAQNAGSGGETVNGQSTGPQSTNSQSTNSQSTNSYIDVEQAKSAALGHAGLSAEDVNFSKAKLDHDDGYTVYEIEFYSGGMEYEYKINALTGDVLEYDWEGYDHDSDGHHMESDGHHSNPDGHHMESDGHH